MLKAYIGMDTHKSKIVLAVAFSNGDPPVLYGTSTSDIKRLVMTIRRLLKKYGLVKDEVKLCYEAGPCGFTIARHLLRMGYNIIVAAPSLIPKAQGDSVKTDRRDAKKLARLYRSGDLVAVHIPDQADEVIRDICRARTDAVDEQKRSKQRLSSFLLRNGHHYKGKSNWTEAHLRYLRELVLTDPVQKLVLEDYLQTIYTAQQRVESLERYMDIHKQQWVRRPFVEALQGFRGFQMVASMVITSELGDLTRFDHPRKLMAYLGLVPSENSSGTKRHQGAITKCGNTHARWILVEVAQSYRYAPKVSKHLSMRQQGLNTEIKAISWKAQKRLHSRYVKLKMRRLHENKIKVAIARELAAFIWELAQLMKTQQNAA